MILADVSEPDDIVTLIEQSVPVTRINLNQTKRSDYYFGGSESKTYQFSRVQINELLSDMDSAENELVRYYNNADQNCLIIEGIASPVAIQLGRKLKDLGVSVRFGKHSTSKLPAAIFTYPIADNGYSYDTKQYNRSKSLLQAWRWRLEQSGIIVIDTVNYYDTALTLVAIYNNCQKPAGEHTTLQRYIRPKIRLSEHDPFVESLMSLSHAYSLNIGEEKAKAIAVHFHSLLDIAECEVGELIQCEGIGRPTAEKILKAIGREL